MVTRELTVNTFTDFGCWLLPFIWSVWTWTFVYCHRQQQENKPAKHAHTQTQRQGIWATKWTKLHSCGSQSYLRMRAIVVSATRTDSSSGSSWIPFGNRRFSITTDSSLLSVLYSNTLPEEEQKEVLKFHWRAETCFRLFVVVPSVCCGLHDEVHVVSALPLTAGGSEIHLLPILSHR